MDSDADLMLRTQAGDQAAYNILVMRYQNALVNFFFKLIWDQQEAEDFAQDIFVKVYIARTSYQKRAKFSTYLFRIATNYWIDYLRTRGKRKKDISLNKEMGEGQDSFSQILPAKTLTPPQQILQNEQMRRTREAIDMLPEEQKIVFLLSETQGMKYQEIAETLDIPLGTVKSRIHAAVLKLRVILIEKGIV